MKKMNHVEWGNAIIAFLSIIYPFIQSMPLSSEVLLFSIGFTALSNFIKNKKIRQSILLISLIGLLYVCYIRFFK